MSCRFSEEITGAVKGRERRLGRGSRETVEGKGDMMS